MATGRGATTDRSLKSSPPRKSTTPYPGSTTIPPALRSLWNVSTAPEDLVLLLAWSPHGLQSTAGPFPRFYLILVCSALRWGLMTRATRYGWRWSTTATTSPPRVRQSMTTPRYISSMARLLTNRPRARWPKTTPLQSTSPRICSSTWARAADLRTGGW